jgi:hypothetical protein
MRKSILLWLILLLPVQCFGQQIAGLDRDYKEGELIALSIVNLPENINKSTYTWVIKDPTSPDKFSKTLDDGSVIFGAGVSAHQIDVECFVAYLDKDLIIQAKVISGTINVGGDSKPKVDIEPDRNPHSLREKSKALGHDFLTSYRTALYNAAKAIRIGTDIRKVYADMQSEWSAARAQAFDRYFKELLSGAQPGDYAQILEMIGDGVID